MNRALLLSAAAATLLSAGPAIAQGAQGTTNPYRRPIDLGENDSATMPSASDRLGVGTRDASDRRTAERARRENGPAVAAKPADIVAQAAVSDTSGQPVGTIERVDTDGAVVATAEGRVKVPLEAFGKNKKGLLIGMTKKDFEALVAKANATPAG